MNFKLKGCTNKSSNTPSEMEPSLWECVCETETKENPEAERTRLPDSTLLQYMQTLLGIRKT